MERDAFPRLLSPWILRDDTDNLLLYKGVVSELKYFVLSPPQALILPFFSGTRSYAEIQAIWLYLTKRTDETGGLRSLDKLVRDLMAPEKIIGLDGTPSPSLRDPAKVPLPDFRRYRWPAERTSIPVSVLVTLTNRCIADCRYCYAERNRCPELTCAEWIEIFDQLSAHLIRLVDLAGADPFARHDIFDLLTAMVERDFIFSVSTKGLVSATAARRLADLGIGRAEPGGLERGLQVSVDSVRNDVASWLTGVTNYCDRAKATTANLIAAGLNPRIKCVLTPYNWSETENLVGTFSALGVRRFQFVQYGRSHYRHSDDLFLTKEQKARLHQSLPALASEHADLEIIYQDETGESQTAAQLKTAWKMRAVCTGGRSALVILPNGDVTLCEQIPHAPEYVVGNLLREDLRNIWNARALTDLLHPPRNKFEGTACFSCQQFDQCHLGRGYCYRDSLLAFGSIYDAPPACPLQTKIPRRII